ncbi:MAG: fused signal recognition particle receptor [Gammaproteobacteria bacterium]|jgi:fused signal recognition particle receptor
MPNDDKSGKKGLFSRLRAGLARTREVLTTDVTDLVRGRANIDEVLVEELESILLSADVGIDACEQLLGNLRESVRRKEAGDSEAVLQALRNAMIALLAPVALPLRVKRGTRPHVILMVGVNGAGKTTTIGKLAARFQSQGLSVMLAAGDTFRAAAVEQLQQWGQRNDVPVVAQAPGADPASVVFDALESATARNVDVLIADTAGRLHTQGGLMDELRKIKRVMSKIDPDAPHETLLVIDAAMGQNAITQARVFHEAVSVDGLVLTKLDGTARGGVVFAIAHQLGLPLRLIGIGEGIDDLRDFEAEDFVKALIDG